MPRAHHTSNNGSPRARCDATAALGLLFASPGDDIYPLRFRRMACEVLEGISDDLVEHFLACAGTARSAIAASGETGVQPWSDDLLGYTKTSGPYPQVRLRMGKVSPTVDYTDMLIAIAHLTHRGLLMPLPLSEQVASFIIPEHSVAFGVSDDTWRYLELLSRAREAIRSEATPTSGEQCDS